jgi:hypothetical protein
MTSLPAPLQFLRAVLVVATVGSLLQNTVLFRWSERLVARWVAANRRGGLQIPIVPRNRRFARAWNLGLLCLCVFLWWLSGTPMVADWVRGHYHA